MVTRFVLALFALSVGLEAQRGARPVGVDGSPCEPALPLTVIAGSVSLADGSPAPDALVVTDVGGLARTGGDGRFRLELELPPEAFELHLTALRTVGSSTRVARLAVAVRPGGTNPVGDLALSAGGGCEPSWLPTFGHFQSAGSPTCFAAWDDGSGPTVFAGSTTSVSRFDGEGWEELPGLFFGGGVQCLVAFDDGQGSKLYAGGSFFMLDGVFARGLVRWDGSAWEILHPNTGQALMDVSSMEIYDDGLGGGPALFVAGNIELDVLGQPARDFLRYDGTWSVAGSPPSGQRIWDLEVFDDGLGGGLELYATGTFDLGGNTTVDVVRWNGTRWELLGADFQTPSSPQFPPLLRTFDDGLGGGLGLCAAGNFTSVGGIGAARAARWDGLAWAPLGSGIGFTASDFAAFDDGSGPGLYAAGTQGRLRRWDGTGWTSPRPPLLSGTTYVEVLDDGGGSTLYVSGGPSVLRWEVDHWDYLMDGLSSGVRALAVHDDGLGGGPALYAGGDFFSAAGRLALGIAKWDGTEWSALGSGVSGPTDVQSVRALAVFDDGGGPVLVAAGDFTEAGGASALNIARWDGTAWDVLGSGLNDEVFALVVHDDGLGGGPALYAGGQFTASGATPLANVARWDGAAWSPLGVGTDAGVRALAVHDDCLGGGPALYAGGTFATAGGLSASKIARWDGSAWSPLGSGLTGFPSSAVETLLSFDDGGGPTLWAGGSFSTAGGNPANRIARWDGFAWSAIPGDVFATVYDLADFDDGTGGGPALYLAGSFSHVDGMPSRGIARWDGTSWSSVGGSLQEGSTGIGLSLLVADGGEGVPALLFGGRFTEVGGSSDSNLARWQGCASVPPTLACPDSVAAGTFSPSGRIVDFEVTATGAGTPAPVVECVPSSGSFFPIGTTMVHCTATDAMDNQSTCDFPVHVFRKARPR